jgi:predicted dehydrogenase
MIGVSVIGLGNALQPHARSLVDLANRARVVWAAASSETRLKDVADRYGFPTTTDITRAIEDPAVDAVLVLTPANAHLPIAEAAFAAGKHVFCEKPLEVSIERGEQLIAAGRRANRKLGICLQHRFRPGSQRMRAVLQSGALGEIQAATMMVPWWRPQSYYDDPGRGVLARDGGGVLMTQAIHSLDLFRWLVGIDRGLCISAGAPGQWCTGHDRRDRCRVSRRPRMDPHYRFTRHRAHRTRRSGGIASGWTSRDDRRQLRIG